eukprot:9246878-Pyramimonas_sp.AAC.1
MTWLVWEDPGLRFGKTRLVWDDPSAVGRPGWFGKTWLGGLRAPGFGMTWLVWEDPVGLGGPG